jgi:hypothetical protein
MTGDIQISPDMKITSALALVHALRTAGKPVRDVYRASDGGCRISFDGWKVDAAAVDEAVAKGWLVLTYPKKSGEWWRLPEHMPAPRPRGWPRARVRGVHRTVLSLSPYLSNPRVSLVLAEILPASPFRSGRLTMSPLTSQDRSTPSYCVTSYTK